jgi:hypothetical protein
METTSKSYPLVTAGSADALVIHCSDPRFQRAFREFIEHELDIHNPIPIIVPGGIHDLVSPARIKAARQLWQQLEFMVQKGGVKRIVMISHEGCQWYAKWNSLVRTRVDEDVVNHLFSAAERLAEKRFNISIETYFARIEDENVVFRRIDRQRGDGP